MVPLLLASLLVLGMLGPPTATAVASSHPDPIEVQGYRANFGVSQAIAEERLETQRQGASIVEVLKAVEGGSYAGVWFDNETGEFVIPLLGQADRTSVDAALEGIGLAGSYRIASADFSWAELEATHERVDHALLPLVRLRLVQTSLDPRTNAVVIDQAEAANSGQRLQIQDLLASGAGAVEKRQKKRDFFRTGPAGCILAEKICDYPLRGGVEIVGGSVACTSGFKAVGNIFSNRFLLTAGHCADEWQNWLTYDAGDGGKAKGIGPTETFSFPVHDWAAIKANGSYWDGKSLAVPGGPLGSRSSALD